MEGLVPEKKKWKDKISLVKQRIITSPVLTACWQEEMDACMHGWIDGRMDGWMDG